MQMHPRMFLTIGTDGFGQRQGRLADGGVDDAEVQRATQFTLEGGGVLFETLEFAEQPQGFLVEQLTLAGQAETTPAPMAQHQPQRRLELAHVGADG